MNKEELLIENQRMINKAESKIALKEDVEYWTKELDTLMNEKVMIEGDQWR